MKITRIMQSPPTRTWKNGEGYVVTTPSVPMEVTIVIDEDRLFKTMGNRAWANSTKKSSECHAVIMAYAKPAS